MNSVCRRLRGSSVSSFEFDYFEGEDAAGAGMFLGDVEQKRMEEMDPFRAALFKLYTQVDDRIG